jgi:hypothetical protein
VAPESLHSVHLKLACNLSGSVSISASLITSDLSIELRVIGNQVVFDVCDFFPPTRSQSRGISFGSGARETISHRTRFLFL